MKGAAATMSFRQTVDALHAMENIIDSSYGQQIKLDKDMMQAFFDMASGLKDSIWAIERTGKENNFNCLFIF